VVWEDGGREAPSYPIFGEAKVLAEGVGQFGAPQILDLRKKISANR